MSSFGLLLSRLREAADTLHVADYTCKVVKIPAMAFWAFVEVAFVNVTAFVAHSVGDIKGEVVTAFLRGHAEQLAVLRL